MKKERLDQILLRRGVVSEARIKEALIRQKSRSGRLGSQLLCIGAITEKELVEALVEQFGLPGTELIGTTVPEAVIRKVPAELAARRSVFPFRFDPDGGTLHLAMLDPLDTKAVAEVKAAAAVARVEPYVAAESALIHAVRVHYHGKRWDAVEDQLIELPHLDGGDAPGRREEAPPRETRTEPADTRLPASEPIPYAKVTDLLIATIQGLSEDRWRGAPWTPPFELIRRDVRTLGERLGLDPVVVDGLEMAALLPAPPRRGTQKGGTGEVRIGGNRVIDLTGALETAAALSVPWGVDGHLRALLGMLSKGALEGPSAEEEDPGPGAQILAVVWHLHAAFGPGESVSEEALHAIRSGLKKLEGCPFSPAVVDGTLDMVEGSSRPDSIAVRKDIFLVSDRNDVSRELAAHLTAEGYRLIELEDFEEARHLFERKPPDAILLNYDWNPDEVTRFSRWIRKGIPLPLLLLSGTTDPDEIARLQSLGFDDHFTPPFDFEAIVTRVKTAMYLSTGTLLF